MELNTELIKLIRTTRSEAFYNRFHGNNAIADTQEDIANAMERVLWNCKVEVPLRKGDHRGTSGWRRLAQNAYGVYLGVLSS